MGNHYVGTVSYKLARERLMAASAYWEVTEVPEENCLRARFRTTGEGRHGFSLYYDNEVDEPVKSENEPQPFVFAALELTIGSIMEDIHGSGLGWFRLSYGMSEDEYRATVAEMKEHLEDQWIEPVPGHLTEAELQTVQDRLEQLIAIHLEGPPTSESVESVLHSEARDSVEAERDDPSLVWADWMARGLPADKAAELRRFIEEDRARSVEREARRNTEREAQSETSLPLDMDDFIKRLHDI
jgi:hypothetical protein